MLFIIAAALSPAGSQFSQYSLIFATSSGVNCTLMASIFSLRYFAFLVLFPCQPTDKTNSMQMTSRTYPGNGIKSIPCAKIHAKVACPGVIPFFTAISFTLSTSSRFLGKFSSLNLG